MKLAAVNGICSVLQATTASGMSCISGHVASWFHAYDDSDQTYIIVKGEITVDRASREVLHASEFRSEANYQATLKGHSLGRTGFKAPFNQTVTVNVSCFSGYCGSLPDQTEQILFLQNDEGTYILDEGHCSSFADRSPTPENIRILQQCMSGGVCEVPEDW